MNRGVNAQRAVDAVLAAPRISEAQYQREREATATWVAGLTLPHGWREVTGPDPALRAFVHLDRRQVLLSIGEWDGRRWLHVSVSRPKYIPSYQDLADVKEVFIGDDLQAVQIFARIQRHVNLHPNVLHLWACLDKAGDGLPDFGQHGTI